MSTTTMEDQLAAIRRRIDRLQDVAELGAAADTSRLQRHLDAVHHQEEFAVTALRSGAHTSEENLGQLKTRLAVAENAVVADLSDGWEAFAAAVEDELRSWDTYLERLQATTAATAGEARERDEAAIADVRTQRLAVFDALATAGKQVNGAWLAQRAHVGAARDELGKKADELSANLN